MKRRMMIVGLWGALIALRIVAVPFIFVKVHLDRLRLSDRIEDVMLDADIALEWRIKALSRGAP